MPAFDPMTVENVFNRRDSSVDGGVDIFCIGTPGSGKTNALIQIALTYMQKYNDVIIWRSSAMCQWTYFLNYSEYGKPVFWLKEGLAYELFDRKTGKSLKLEDYVEVRRWSSAEELVKKLDKKRINIVEAVPHSSINPKQKLAFCKDWAYIFEALISRRYPENVTIAFDELEDLVPEGVGADFWDVELSLASFIRSFRKNSVSFVASIHSLEEISWRVNKKIRWVVYMQGSSLKKSSNMKKYTMNTAAIPVGDAYIEGSGGYFEKFSFAFKGKECKFRANIFWADDD